MYSRLYGKLGFIWAVIFGVVIGGCASTVRFANGDSTQKKVGLVTHYRVGQTFVGKCSYYAHKFNGRLTASGEIYNMYDLTAAHRSLPFGTLLKVENLQNGKTVRVRVNDRGPFKKNRILDVSLKAAQALGMIGTGTTKVKITIIRLGDNKKQ